MRKELLTASLAFLLLFSACRRTDGPSTSPAADQGGGGGILSGLTDQTEEAVALVNDANIELKKIKTIYRENEGQKEELKEAMSKKETEKVKKLADNLLSEINEGMSLGESAISKIEQAQELNINPTFKEYLRLKEDALRKQLAAFEYRRKAAVLLRDGFGGADKEQIEKTKADWKELEENFQKYMEVARQQSQDANKLAKDSMRKTS